ncbi:hypothetical protein RN001_001251 [Aquatica leii]|uniref:DDHD domain-containing protein n=1 Tax=Aquatica leii TaxID=1421715 RepID=A0AAN7PBB3_9COLE|nr:hypothetical protein RN001_001251 [Aquatica leii]
MPKRPLTIAELEKIIAEELFSDVESDSSDIEEGNEDIVFDPEPISEVSDNEPDIDLTIVLVDSDTEKIISTDDGRYDVNLLYRKRNPVYWSENSTEVRRCSWFYKSYNDTYYTPFEEHISEILECEYRNAYEIGSWHCVLELPNGDTIVFNDPDDIILLATKSWPRQCLVKRGIDDEFEITDNEPVRVDHLIFVIHGIGAICDFRLRTIEEVVNVFREKVLKFLKEQNSIEQEVKTKRVEVLPINWHKSLHNENSKTDKNLHSITLESLPLLRNFTNDNLIDVLLYTSTIYSQIILTSVTSELNRIYDLFKQRNPIFDGEISLVGHSLGSVIIFDLLSHQQVQQQNDKLKPNVTGTRCILSHPSNTRINLLSPTGNKLQLQCPQLKFYPLVFFAVGSPLGLFLTVRGIDKLGTEFSLPTCRHFFNIFHPCDPIAYRVEPLINDKLENLPPYLIPYFDKSCFYIKIKDIISMGKNVKSSILKYLKTKSIATLKSAYLRLSNKQEVNGTNSEENISAASSRSLSYHNSSGNLNEGRRIDYSLQETSVEYLNKYVCAVTSHACYW